MKVAVVAAGFRDRFPRRSSNRGDEFSLEPLSFAAYDYSENRKKRVNHHIGGRNIAVLVF
jgi:hypothetical protein